MRETFMATELGHVRVIVHTRDSILILTPDESPLMVNRVPVRLRVDLRRGENTEGQWWTPYFGARRADASGDTSQAADRKIREKVIGAVIAWTLTDDGAYVLAQAERDHRIAEHTRKLSEVEELERKLNIARAELIELAERIDA